MLASVELKKRENRDDLDFLQMNGLRTLQYIYSIQVKKLPETSACGFDGTLIHVNYFICIKKVNYDTELKHNNENLQSQIILTIIPIANDFFLPIRTSIYCQTGINIIADT